MYTNCLRYYLLEHLLFNIQDLNTHIPLLNGCGQYYPIYQSTILHTLYNTALIICIKLNYEISFQK